MLVGLSLRACLLGRDCAKPCGVREAKRHLAGDLIKILWRDADRLLDKHGRLRRQGLLLLKRVLDDDIIRLKIRGANLRVTRVRLLIEGVFGARTVPPTLNFFLLMLLLLLMGERSLLIVRAAKVSLFFVIDGEARIARERGLQHFNMTGGHGTETAIVVDFVNLEDRRGRLRVSGSSLVAVLS